MQILCAGGVSIADWDRAIDSWTRSGTEYQHFRYIRAVALANAARRLYDAELITTTQLASRLGVTRQAILARVRRGTLQPFKTLANGHHLFRVDT